MSKYIFKLFLTIVSITIFSCDSEQTASTSDKKLKIVATTGMIADAVMNIVGDSAEVLSLMGPGVDPHLYKVTQSDIKKLMNADVIL